MNFKARYRPFQFSVRFSVRSLLLLTFAVGVVLGIVMTLAPYVHRAREKARNSPCTNQLRIGVPVASDKVSDVCAEWGVARAPASSEQPQRMPTRDELR